VFKTHVLVDLLYNNRCHGYLGTIAFLLVINIK